MGRFLSNYFDLLFYLGMARQKFVAAADVNWLLSDTVMLVLSRRFRAEAGGRRTTRKPIRRAHIADIVNFQLRRGGTNPPLQHRSSDHDSRHRRKIFLQASPFPWYSFLFFPFVLFCRAVRPSEAKSCSVWRGVCHVRVLC